MTDATGLPAARPRKILTQIAPVTWEHPADRAALQTLRSVPGFDEVVRKIVGFLGERGIRLMFQANAVRVGPTQFPVLHTLLTEVSTTMDWPVVPELYVTQTPFVNAAAVGIDKPFIVLNTLAITHPFATLRAAELQRWIEAGDYDRIVKGEYAHRGTEQEERPLKDDLGEAAAHYAREAKKTVDGVTDAAKRAAQAFSEA